MQAKVLLFIDSFVNKLPGCAIIRGTLESTLSKALQKYYTRKGNKILFSNGMTLNQLAWEMWERLEYQGVDPSVLSKVLNNKRIFSPRQLEYFCLILKIRGNEKIQLEEILLEENAKKFGLDTSSIREKNYIEFLEDNLKDIYLMRRTGRPYLVVDWAQNVADRIDSKIASGKHRDRGLKLLRLKGAFIREKMRALLESTPPSELGRVVSGTVSEFQQIGKILKDKYFLGLSWYLLGEISYLDKKSDETINHNTRAIKLIGFDSESEEMLLALRNTAITYARDNNLVEYESVNKALSAKLDIFPDEYRSVIEESRARCEMYLGRSGKDNHLKQAWDDYNKFFKEGDRLNSLRKIQLIRTELELGSTSSSPSNLSRLESIGEEAIFLARKHWYFRYEDTINNLLKNLLN